MTTPIVIEIRRNGNLVPRPAPSGSTASTTQPQRPPR
jgi:hypothetical protein